MDEDHFLTITSCGRCACIELYTGENCLFCGTAEQTLKDVTEELQIPEEALCRIEISTTGNRAFDAPVMSIPTLRICDRTITGLPDEESLRDAIVRLLLHPCFKWSGASRAPPDEVPSLTHASVL